ncbi:Hypothetical predicted protein, partial [Lynx pardinus]
MISQFVGSSPVSGSVLTAQSLETCFGVCVSLSLCLSPALSQKKFCLLKKKEQWTLLVHQLRQTHPSD